MIIDFHTHIFPDKIAQKTIDHLSQKGGIPPFSNGTVLGLLENERVDLRITLPVLTNPASFESVNRFAHEVNQNYKEKIISFGAIHPKCDDIDGKMKFLKERGFKGVKIHPDYQNTYINDEGYVKIMESAREYDLIVTTHAGLDVAYQNDIHCPPALALELIKKVPHSKFVLAHLGGAGLHDEVIKYLCYEDVYFDTAYLLRYTEKDKFTEILNKHGEDRLLFASDSPWSDVNTNLDIITSYVDNKDTLDKILYKNAKKLLNI